jgi:hypothetical protein
MEVFRKHTSCGAYWWHFHSIYMIISRDITEKLAPTGLEFLSVFGPRNTPKKIPRNTHLYWMRVPPIDFSRCMHSNEYHFIKSKKISHKIIRGDLCRMNFRNTVAWGTVYIDKNGARIRVPRIEKPIDTSFSDT